MSKGIESNIDNNVAVIGTVIIRMGKLMQDTILPNQEAITNELKEINERLRRIEEHIKGEDLYE